MSKHGIAHVGFVMMACLLAVAFPALARERGGSPNAPEVAEPSQNLPPLPDMPEPAAPVVQSGIPALPASNPCTSETIVGLWKLQNVYEDPAGSETASFSVSPLQYLFFGGKGIYGRYNATADGMKPKAIVGEMKTHTTGLQQYVVQESGMVYYYLDKVANDVQACFIVEDERSPFLRGNMLLMPPKGQITGRLIKHYVKIWPTAYPAENTKRNKKQGYPQPQAAPPTTLTEP